MTTGRKFAGIAMLAGAVCIAVSGCMTTGKKGIKVAPSKLQYPFIASAYRGSMAEIYPAIPTDKPNKITLAFTYPRGGVVEFSTGSKIRIADGEGESAMVCGPGVYPFSFKDSYAVDSGKPLLTGAFMVHNVTKTASLATFGLTEDTKVFNSKIFAKAKQGMLATGTIAFDDRNVVTYWLGNRTKLHAGGEATICMDFSGTHAISELRIEDKKVEGFASDLKVWRYAKGARGTMIKLGSQEYRLEFTAAGKRYNGFIRELKDNEFTAFVKVPCSIPKDLLDSAAGGTVSKYSVKTSGDNPENVAEIVFSVK